MNASIRVVMIAILLAGLSLARPVLAVPPVNAPIIGEIERISVNNSSDPWSNGVIVVGGQVVIIPRNLLIDLPANRLTLQQIFAQAPAACLAAGESGLAKADTCNLSGSGGIATVTANRSSNGNVIAGDLFIEKGVESVSGVVTYINYNQGYFRLNGKLGNSAKGVMVRSNDPGARHTVQKGSGCATAGPAEPNCSPDPRFTLDPDNYVQSFSSGVPICIPSTVARQFVDALDLNGDGDTTELLTAEALADGTGDLLCPATNRSPLVVSEPPMDDSRRFAPLMLGDHLIAEGNFETINGVRFLSAHTMQVSKALTTKNLPTQPDYIFLAEVGIDAPAFQNERARSLFIGFASLDTDVLLWSRHFDPIDNLPHEVPLASIRGCDQVGGAGSCGNQGVVGAGNLIWKLRHDVDFNPAVNIKPELNPCSIINAEPRFGAVSCNPASRADQFGVLSPLPREIQARTGHSLANPGLITLDIQGNEATSGQYIFPFGVGLGGVGFPEMVEIDLNALNTAFSFSGIPWMMDRRLSPGGCIGDCEGTPQPLDPFPAEETDPRFLASVPDPARMMGFFPFGEADLLVLPPAIPRPFGVAPTPPLVLPLLVPGVTTSSLSGRVTKGGDGLNVVIMTLTDAVTSTVIKRTQTDFTGNYTFTGVVDGSYVITPTRSSKIFTPTSLPVEVTTPGAITVSDFTTP